MNDSLKPAGQTGHDILEQYTRSLKAARMIGKGLVPGAPRHVVCDGGLVAAVDTLGNSCWLHAGSTA
jgi:type IV secretory pathway TrbD component